MLQLTINKTLHRRKMEHKPATSTKTSRLYRLHQKNRRPPRKRIIIKPTTVPTMRPTFDLCDEPAK
jgi:hypothetical protein